MKTELSDSQARGVRRLLMHRLNSYFGDDTVQYQRIQGLSNYELEKEVKELFKINTTVSYFGG